MADKVTTYQCPACTGPLHFDGKTGILKCDYCGSTYTVEEVEKLFAAKNEAAAAAFTDGRIFRCRQPVSSGLIRSGSFRMGERCRKDEGLQLYLLRGGADLR